MQFFIFVYPRNYPSNTIFHYDPSCKMMRDHPSNNLSHYNLSCKIHSNKQKQCIQKLSG